MHGTFDELRDARPGKWLPIRTDGREAETGTLLFVHEDPKIVGKALVNESSSPITPPRSASTKKTAPEPGET